MFTRTSATGHRGLGRGVTGRWSNGLVKVAIVTESFLPHMNGVTRSVLQVLDHLRREGHEALVLAPGAPPTRVNGFPVIALPSVSLPGYPEVQIPVATPSRIARELTAFGPDVVHLASPFMIGGSTMRAAADLAVPVVAIYQTDVAGFAQRYGLAGLGRAAWRRLRLIHERADLTLAPTPTVARGLTGHGIPRVEVWPRGVDTAAFSPAHRSESLRRELAPNGEVLVGYLGRLAAEKQIDDLAVLESLPGVRLVVIGDGPERESLRHLLPGAAFTGALSGSDLSTTLASLDLLAHPCPHETFCQAAQEAMASGLPVVAVGAGGLLDLVDHSRTGWHYAPGDLADLRARVADLAGDPRKRRAMGAAAHRAVRSRTWQVVCDRLLEHYRAVTRSPVDHR